MSLPKAVGPRDMRDLHTDTLKVKVRIFSGIGFSIVAAGSIPFIPAIARSHSQSAAMALEYLII
jgi:hypothetical protein